MAVSLAGDAPNKNPLSHKVKKLLTVDIDKDANLLDGLTAISPIFKTNILRNRRALREDIEKQHLYLCESFLAAFVNVKHCVDELEGDVKEMQNHCREINEQLMTLRSNTDDLLKEACDIQAQKSETELKIKLFEDLSESFQLSSADIENLCKADLKHDNKFFHALDRANTVEKNCKRLLLSDKQTLGLSLLDAVHSHLETAYKRLYHWLQDELRSKTQELPEFPSLVRKSVVELQSRPVLFKCALDEYTTARRDYAVSAFLNALTVGYPHSSWQTKPIGNTGSKPMELHAHDPVRYTSDMLAWIHQLTASEREASEQLMRDIPRDTRGLKDILQFCLDGITGALASPFKMRMEQLLVSQQDGLLLYRINNVLRFYEHTLSGLLPDSSILFVATHEMQVLSWRLLFSSLNNYCRQTLEQPEFPPSDLSVSDTVQDTLQLLLQILNAHDISLLPEAVRKSSLEEIINVLVTPLTAYCQQSADQLLQSAVTQSELLSADAGGEPVTRPLADVSGHPSRAKSAAYLANCVYAIQSALATASADRTLECGHIGRLADLLEASVETLVTAQVTCVLNQTRLAALWTRLSPEKEVPLLLLADSLEDEVEAEAKSVASVSEVEVADAMVRFNVYLSNPDRSYLPELQLLYAQRLRKAVRRRAADAIHSHYQRVYEALQRSSPSDPAGLRLPIKLHTPEEVASLILNF